MRQVLKNEVLKIIEDGVIYPISNSKCVSHVQVIPMKAGETVVNNNKDKLVYTRIVKGVDYVYRL